MIEKWNEMSLERVNLIKEIKLRSWLKASFYDIFQLLQRNARIQRVFDALRIFGVNLHQGGRHCAAASDDDESEDGGHGRVVVAGSRFGGILSFGGEYLLNIFLKPLVKRQM